MSHLEIIQKLNEFVKTKQLEKIRPLLHKNIKWNQMKSTDIQRNPTTSCDIQWKAMKSNEVN